MESKGVVLINAERQRQIEGEGFDAKHDAEHTTGSMALAGGSYAIDYVLSKKWGGRMSSPLKYWPWDSRLWKPTPGDPIKQLVKAGALIAAEIDRLLAEEETKPNAIVIRRNMTIAFERVADPKGMKWVHNNSPVPFEMAVMPKGQEGEFLLPNGQYYIMVEGKDGVLHAYDHLTTMNRLETGRYD